MKETNSDIGKITLDEVNDVNMAKDCSMNTNKLKRLLNDTTF